LAISLSTVDILYLDCVAFRLKQRASSGLQELHYGEQNHDLQFGAFPSAILLWLLLCLLEASLHCRRVTNLSIQVEFLQAIRSTI